MGYEDENVEIKFDEEEKLYNGYIYLITNLINGKQYVGQTTCSVEERWRGHVDKAKNNPSIMVDYAIRKYGKENFSIEEIEYLENVTSSFIDSREEFWIDEYKTCVRKYGSDAGYNVSFGGSTGMRRFTVEEEQMLIEAYMKGDQTLGELSSMFECTSGAIRRVIAKYDLPERSEKENYDLMMRKIGMPVIRCDDNWNELERYDSSTLAAQWLIDHGKTQTNNTETIGRRIRQYAVIDRKAYGFFWKLPTLSEEEKEKRAAEYLEYKKRNSSKSVRKKARKCSMCGDKISNSATYCRKHALKRRKSQTKGELKSSNKCPICGEEISRKARYCRKHASKMSIIERPTEHPLFSDKNEEFADKSNIARIQTGLDPILGTRLMPEEELLFLLRFHSLEEIGKLCGVSGNAVANFAKRIFGIDTNRRNKCRIWNDEYECFEYCESLPFTIDYFIDWISQGKTVEELRKLYHVGTKQAFHKYLVRSFGEEQIQAAYNQAGVANSKHACIELKSGRKFANLGEIARYIWENNERVRLEYPDVKKLNRKIRDHLIQKSETVFHCLDYEIALL